MVLSKPLDTTQTLLYPFAELGLILQSSVSRVTLDRLLGSPSRQALVFLTLNGGDYISSAGVCGVQRADVRCSGHSDPVTGACSHKRWRRIKFHVFLLLGPCCFHFTPPPAGRHSGKQRQHSSAVRVLLSISPVLGCSV